MFSWQHLLIAIILIPDYFSQGFGYKKGNCVAVHFNRTILRHDCQPITVPSAICVGVCPSSTRPMFIHNRSIKLKSCEFCQPVRLEFKKYRLRCGRRTKRQKVVVVSRVLDCECKIGSC